MFNRCIASPNSSDPRTEVLIQVHEEKFISIKKILWRSDEYTKSPASIQCCGTFLLPMMFEYTQREKHSEVFFAAWRYELSITFTSLLASSFWPVEQPRTAWNSLEGCLKILFTFKRLLKKFRCWIVSEKFTSRFWVTHAFLSRKFI